MFQQFCQLTAYAECVLVILLASCWLSGGHKSDIFVATRAILIFKWWRNFVDPTTRQTVRTCAKKKKWYTHQGELSQPLSALTDLKNFPQPSETVEEWGYCVKGCFSLRAKKRKNSCGSRVSVDIVKVPQFLFALKKKTQNWFVYLLFSFLFHTSMQNPKILCTGNTSLGIVYLYCDFCLQLHHLPVVNV